MQKRKGRDRPNLVVSRNPPLDVPPSPGWLARLIRMAERFGFLIAFALTIMALLVFFIGPDLIEQEADPASGLAGAQGRDLLPEGQDGSAGHAAQAAAVSLSIATNPAGAAIYVDGDYAGVSPLRGLAVAQGRRLISVHKPDYAPLDTVLTLDETSTSLTVALRDGVVILAPAGVRTPPEVRRTPPPSAPESHGQQPPASAPAVPVAEVEPVVPVGTLHVVSAPPGASVWMADREVGVTPLLLRSVQAGPQQVTLRLDGYEDFKKTVVVTPAQPSTVSGQLIQQFGTLKVLALPSGTIYIDDELRKNEANSWYVVTLTPGYHRLRVRHPSLGTWEQVIDVAAGEEHPVTIDFNKAR